MATSIEALVGFSKHDSEPVSPDEISVPGFPDNRVGLVPCRIDDARQVEDLGLDRHGFVLTSHEFGLTDERDVEALQAYRDDMAAFLRDRLDASLIVPSHIGLCVRYAKRLAGVPRLEGVAGFVDDEAPANFAHVDYLQPDLIVPYAAQEASLDGFDVTSYSRMVVIQTWRSLSDPPQDVPLALCDRRTLREEDVLQRTGVLPPQNNHEVANQVYHIGGIHFSPNQKWYYFPRMTPDEVIVFTGLDTARSSGGRVAHAAFENRAEHRRAISRVSIEARYYAYYE